MKAQLYDIKGNKKAEVELPGIFNTHVREDITQKCFEVSKEMQQYGIYVEAGKRHSASGIISHKRHDWKGQYGRGIARTPRKIMSRRGTQFNWVGAEVSNTRGGRRPHGPKVSQEVKKANKKEIRLARNSAIAATANEKYITRRYARIDKLPVAMPLVIESHLDNIKMKHFIEMLNKISSTVTDLAMKHKDVRAGKGKGRGRKYKSNAGLLLVTGNNEKVRLSGIDVRSVKNLEIADLYPLGRITMYTQKALEELK